MRTALHRLITGKPCLKRHSANLSEDCHSCSGEELEDVEKEIKLVIYLLQSVEVSLKAYKATLKFGSCLIRVEYC